PGVQRIASVSVDKNATSTFKGLDVSEAVRRGAQNIIVVQMYDDYIKFLKAYKGDGGEQAFKQLYVTQLKRSDTEEMKLAQVTGKVALAKGPGDYTAKRVAIVAGYKEAARLVKELRKEPPSHSR